ncbi:MAG: spinster family MFS transporter [Hyphomonadaceae bacterium]
MAEASAPEAPIAAAVGQAGRPNPLYANYVLAILVATYTSGWVDRAVMGVLGQAIKVEMRLADWQLGLLTGFAFSIFYSVLGFPLARIAEKYSRVNLMTVCLILWSGMTALCGFATNFVMLVLFRCGVGVGEAGCAPGCHSLLTDYFEPKKRTTAFAIYSLGVPLGGMIGAIMGGVITEYISWRAALIAVGVPGLVLALIMKLTVKEPARGRMEAPAEAAASAVTGPPPSLWATWRVFFSKPTFRHIAFALCILITSGSASGAFLGPYYVRQFHLNFAEVGLIIGLMSGVSSIVGTLATGWIAERLGKLHPRWYMLVPAIGVAVSAPITLAAYLQTNWMATAGLLLVQTLLQAAYLAPAFAAVHNMVSPQMRATAAATIYFFMNIIGMSIGPVVAGYGIDVFSSQLFASAGGGDFVTMCPGGVAAQTATDFIKSACAQAQAKSTQWALLLGTPLILWAALHYYLASRTIAKDLNPGVAH